MNYTIVKSNLLRIIYLIAVGALCFSGIKEAYKGSLLGLLRYFTNISNLMVFLMILCQLVLIFVNIIGKRQGDSQLKIPAMIKGWVVVCISFTFLTCFFVLNPFKMPTDRQDAIIHYLVPLFVVLEFILFEAHGRFQAYYPLCWGLTPIVYYGYVWILYMNRIWFGGSRFPYFFMNHLAYGWGFVLKILCMLLVVFVAFGYLMYLIDQFPAIVNRIRKSDRSRGRIC